MSTFWKNWLMAWCGGVALFGVVLTTGAFPATDGLMRWLLGVLGGAPAEMTPPLRFALAVMGPVSIGWALTFAAAFRAAIMLGDAGAPVWRLTTAGVLVWFVVDSSLSVATGFGLNVAPNVVLLAGYLLPLIRTGVLSGRPLSATGVHG
ncbi:hypothetical protein GVN21_18015 [Caulobacter sp. SLTY]|uniref:hypothetical protein n=1 Tax=Caulobacter sp. SLTY TaxID=2683262 RepID=UPI001411F893|nr:hypothetical protein [Caulobacter sp. SLTY]NBB17262.1 hypothetical protein [Caulobacter sp. SLTY]